MNTASLTFPVHNSNVGRAISQSLYLWVCLGVLFNICALPWKCILVYDRTKVVTTDHSLPIKVLWLLKKWLHFPRRSHPEINQIQQWQACIFRCKEWRNPQLAFSYQGAFYLGLLSFDDCRSTCQLSHAIASGAEARDPWTRPKFKPRWNQGFVHRFLACFPPHLVRGESTCSRQLKGID